jgi:hypothetical protein
MAKPIKKILKKKPAPVVEEEIIEDEEIVEEEQPVEEVETDEEIVEEGAEEVVEEEEEVVEEEVAEEDASEEDLAEEEVEEVEEEAPAPVKKVAKVKAAVVPLSKEQIAHLLALKDKYNAAGDVVKARGIRQKLRAAGHYISKQKGFQPFGGKVPHKKAVAAVAAPIKKVVMVKKVIRK